MLLLPPCVGSAVLTQLMCSGPHDSGKMIGENPCVWGQLDHSVPALAAHLLETIVRTVHLGARIKEKPKKKRKKGKTQPRKWDVTSSGKALVFSGLVLRKKEWPVGAHGVSLELGKPAVLV